MELRCRSCGVRFNLGDYYTRTLSRTPATDEELEERLANVPVNRL